MARKKKKKHHDEHMDESWLIPYADLMTLLLALFIVLFAMSSVDAVKFQQLSKAFNDIFTSGTGVMDFSSPMETNGRSDSQNETMIQSKGEVRKALGEKDYKELSAMQERVNEYIEKSDIKDKLGTSLTGEGLMISIRDNVLFGSGSADVLPRDRQVAKEIAALLVMDPPRSIVISGHTDNVPISNSQFNSNWDLSVMRAVNFMKVVLENPALSPEWFSAKGYGEFKPIASNKTAEGKSKNRRVEILITPRTQLNK
ncbi:flagellar motor protein MotB [Bacillus massiliigorillae]|uniref:flagellar motor protein MotB n=1 Tax=Bacillus massiliigorillae TaxID=1243664 RepID=UPI00039C8547|nr:flagellar motor protein MotB [Bacillus massiliigorillae]